MTGSAGLQRTLVLNVNDHDGVRYMTSRMLDRAGYEVAEAANGSDALEMVERLKPRLLVLDIKLPDIGGLEVCRQIKVNPRTRSIKVLHTSAVFVAPEAKVQSLNSGADSYLSHPYEQEELIATVRSLLRLSDAEQQLRDTAAQLQQANQRTHEFLAMLAHELRNPLSAIATCSPLLESKEPRDEVEKSVYQILRRQTDNLRRLVEDLLDTARVTQGKIEPKWEIVDLVALLGRVTDSARRSLTELREQTLQLHLPEPPVLVRGDSLRLEQVFANLLDNASKYSDGGGRIDVTLRVDARDPEAELPLGKAIVTIEDTGIGIPPEAIGSIFNLFSQAEVPLSRTRGGLGIGLTLVRALVEIHGGAITAASDGAGKGTRMEVSLPLMEERAVNTVRTSESAAPEQAAQRRILVVEDNLDAQNMLRFLLQMWGHQVTTASDGAAGVEAIRSAEPDIALVDIGLPIANGYELARAVRETPGIKQPLLVALTGYGAPEQRARARQAGFDRHLVKPLDPGQLAQVIAQGRE